MGRQHIFIITGNQGEGKTTALAEVVDELKKSNIPLGGFTAPGKWTDEVRSSFSIADVNSSEAQLLCQDKPKKGFEKNGRFYFSRAAITFGESLLKNTDDKSILVIDEIGLFETRGKVWGPALQFILHEKLNPVLITVRTQFLEQIISSFGLINPAVFNVREEPQVIAGKIVEKYREPISPQ